MKGLIFGILRYLNSWKIQLHQLQTASMAEKNGFDITNKINFNFKIFVALW